jgi:aspartyl-tRNA synthetase
MANIEGIYRTHTCGDIRRSHVGQAVTLSGWVYRKRDHGQLIFLDLRDHYGVTQCVLTPLEAAHEQIQSLKLESVVTVEGVVAARDAVNVNDRVPTGEVEIHVRNLVALSAAEVLPFQLTSEDIPEEQRLRYRFLDLRRERPHANIVLRSKVVSTIRRLMTEAEPSNLCIPTRRTNGPMVAASCGRTVDERRALGD